MDKGIAFAGNLIVDHIKHIDNYPAPHTLATITGETASPGGLACNCALDMARLAPHIPLEVIGVVGDDADGDAIMKALGQHPSIGTSGVRRAGRTSYTDVMTTPDGGRTFFQCRGANALLGPEDFDFGHLVADILHIGYILLLDRLDGPDPDYPSALCRVLDAARRRGIATSIDVVSEDSGRFARLVPPALRHTDYCVINEIEAGRTTGIPLTRDGRPLAENMGPCLEKLAEMGVARWAVIHAQSGAWGLDVPTGRMVYEAAWDIPPGFKRSSVGAGDAFATGILYGAYTGMDLAGAIHTAGAVAAHSLSGLGASDAILPLDALMAAMESFKK